METQTQSSTLPTGDQRSPKMQRTPTLQELRLDVAWEARHGITDRVGCRLCAELLVSLYDHIPRHEGWTINRYKTEYPGAPMMSPEYRTRQTTAEAERLRDNPEEKRKARQRTIRWRETKPEAYKAARARSWAKPETKLKSYANKKKRLRIVREKLAQAERILLAQQQTQQEPKRTGGRPSKTELYLKAKELRSAGRTWPQIATILLPQETNRHAAAERLRIGVLGLRKVLHP